MAVLTRQSGALTSQKFVQRFSRKETEVTTNKRTAFGGITFSTKKGSLFPL